MSNRYLSPSFFTNYLESQKYMEPAYLGTYIKVIDVDIDCKYKNNFLLKRFFSYK